MKIIKKVITLDDGRTIEIETGKLAKQADGSVVVKMGGTMLLAAVTCAKKQSPTRTLCRSLLITKKNMPLPAGIRAVL
jgi:polyribonucleotide nucleotidyltransferase